MPDLNFWNEMLYFQPRIINFPGISVILCCFIFRAESTHAQPDTDLALPPVPENETISRQLELSLQNGTSTDCSTDDSSDVMTLRGRINPRSRWTRFSVYPDPSFNASERTLINNAMLRLSRAVPCLRFGLYRPGKRPSGDYVHIRKVPGRGCRAAVGRRGGAQNMNLESPRCMNIGTIMHEMMHALGFSHEHTQPNRDNYVTIHPENIRPGQEHNFRKNPASLVTSFGIRYNPRSIMHYRSTTSSRNGQPTITARNGGDVGSTGELQSTDIAKLRRMYRCK